jgi:hypothetical protein
MARYHINPTTGIPSVCKALSLYSHKHYESDYFPSLKEAREAHEKRMKERAFQDPKQESVSGERYILQSGDHQYKSQDKVLSGDDYVSRLGNTVKLKSSGETGTITRAIRHGNGDKSIWLNLDDGNDKAVSESEIESLVTTSDTVGAKYSMFGLRVA